MVRATFSFLVLCCVGLLHPQQAHAQFPSEIWHEGKLVLESGDTLRGMIKYDFQQDLVQVAAKGQAPEVFTARKVLFFEIYELAIHKYRRFFALPYAAQTGYKAPIFFELLEEGKLTLLAREFLEYKSYRSMYFGMYTRLVLSYKFYFLNENGDITEFNGNRQTLLHATGNRADEVDTYMHRNHLKIDDRGDLTQIVDYYNSLFGS